MTEKRMFVLMLESIGYGVLILSAGWVTALGVFIVHWAINVDYSK